MKLSIESADGTLEGLTFKNADGETMSFNEVNVNISPNGIEAVALLQATLIRVDGDAKVMLLDPNTGHTKEVLSIQFTDGSSFRVPPSLKIAGGETPAIYVPGDDTPGSSGIMARCESCGALYRDGKFEHVMGCPLDHTDKAQH